MITLCALALLGAPVVLTSTQSDGGVRVELGAQLFARARFTRGEDDVWSERISLSRARLLATLRWREVLRVTIEPDFAGAACSAAGTVCDDAELSDVYFEVRPAEPLDLRVGQAKAPFGLVETTGEWELPSQRRGLVSELVSGRLGFGGRRLGARARLDLAEVPAKPRLELGAYAGEVGTGRVDGAVRLGVKPLKGLRVEAAGYARSSAQVNDGHGYAASFGATYTGGRAFLLGEVLLGRARRLSIAAATAVDSTFLGARVLGAYGFRLGGGHELEPYAGVDFFDPGTATTADAGLALRGGLNYYWERRFRFAVEVDHRRREDAFAAPAETILTAATGVSLE